MVFAISGLLGTGLLGYEYYKDFQERRRQEATARQKQQQQEEEEIVRRAQEEAQQREEDLVHYIEQARGAIAKKNWAVAQSNLERAAAVNPNHPAVASYSLPSCSPPNSRTSDPKPEPIIRPASN